MAALVAAIHALVFLAATKDMDGRDKPGHDDAGDCPTSQNVMAGFMPAIHVLLR
jgi:hypothetical protein